MRLSKQLFPERYVVPEDSSSLPTYKLIERVGFVEFTIPGVPTFLPLGQILIKKICDIIREEAVTEGFNEVYFPLFEKVDILNKSGAYQPYKEQYIRVDFPKKDLVLTATSEEPILELALSGLHSYRQLPIKLFQIADKFRYVTRTKGIIRGRQFLSADFTCLVADKKSLEETTNSFENLAQRAFTSMGLSPQRVSKGRDYVDFVITSEDGEQRDNSGNKAFSIGMYHKYVLTPVFQPTFLNKEGQAQNILIGTYGIGIQRCLISIIEQQRDSKGISFSEKIKPFLYSIIVIEPRDNRQLEVAINIYERLKEKSKKIMLDDRTNLTFKQKADFSDFLGIPEKIIIGKREVSTGFLTVKNRGGDKEEKINLEDLLKK